MEKKTKVLVYLPRKLYVELHERQLTNHVSYLVSRLLEEFLKATDVRISWTEMESKAEQREYLERRLREFLSRNGLSAEAVKSPVQERTKQAEPPAEPPKSSVQEPPKEVYAVSKSKPVKEEPPPPPEEDNDIDILKSLENLW
jgi:hypothetical protein